MTRWQCVQALTLILMTMPISFAQQSGTSSSSGGLLLVANKGDQNLSLVDAREGKVVASVPEDGVTGHEVIASPDGRLAFVPIYGDSGVGKPGTDGRLVRVIDLTAHKVVGTVDFGRGVRPHCAMIGPRDGLLYVTTEIENSVSVIDPKTLKVVGSIPTGQAESHMLAITRDNRRGYTANVASGTVSVLDLKKRKTITVIPVAGQVQRISLSTDDRFSFTSDQTSPRLAVIDNAADKVKTWVELPGTGYGSAPTPDGRFLLIAIPKVNKVAVVNLSTMKTERTIEVPAAPQEVVIRPDGREAYVSCDASGQVAVIDLADWKVARIVNTGRGADGLAWAAAAKE